MAKGDWTYEEMEAANEGLRASKEALLRRNEDQRKEIARLHEVVRRLREQLKEKHHVPE